MSSKIFCIALWYVALTFFRLKGISYSRRCLWVCKRRWPPSLPVPFGVDYPAVQSMNGKASCPVVESILSLVTRSGKSSFGYALFRSQKSTQMRSCPFFFLTGTTFVIQVEYLTSRTNPASMSLLTSFSISGTNSRRECRSWGHTLFYG